MKEKSIAGEAGPAKSRRRAAAKLPQAMKLPADLGIEQASELRAQLARNLASTKAVVLDAADVQRIHTAAVQLFCLFCRDRRSAGREVHWRQPSEALRSAAALLGVTTLLQISRE